MIQSLDTLDIGNIAIIEEITEDCNLRRRFLDIGIIPGNKIEYLLKSPANDPVAYLIKGAVIAIRNEDAACILVRKVNNEKR